MSAVGDFLMGVVGYGVPQQLAAVDKREAQAAERRRLEDREELRDRRARDLLEQRLQAQADMQAERLGVGLLGRAARSGTGARAGSGGGIDAEGYARAYTQGREGISAKEAAAVERGENPFTTTSGEDREGNPIEHGDDARFMRVAKVFNQALSRGRAGAQADDLAKAERTEFETQGMREAMASGDEKRAGLLGRVIGAGKGQGGFKASDGVVVDEFSGTSAPTAVGQARIGADRARANQANAGATENIAQADRARRETGGLRDGQTLHSLDGDVARAEKAAMDARSDVAKTTPGSKTSAQARQVLEAAEQRLREVKAERDGFRTSAGSKNGQASRVDMGKAERIKAEYRAGKIDRAEAKRQLQTLGLK
jgi:hypothetical protein